MDDQNTNTHKAMPVTIILCIIINKNNVKGFRVRAEFQRVAQVCLESTMRLQSFFEICMIEIAIGNCETHYLEIMHFAYKQV